MTVDDGRRMTVDDRRWMTVNDLIRET